ncbi:MAG: DUF4131 domain-containing protein, partial [Planctomycetaceae bacterium]|nr:DUF4131 domain-containing protein [Planctomycetaceae bacterium]
MTSREPLPVCLAALCLGIAVDKMLGVSPWLWGTLFLILAAVWVKFRVQSAKCKVGSTVATSAGAKCKAKDSELCTLNFALLRSTLVLLGLIAVFGGLWHHLYWNFFPPNDPGLFRLDEPTPVVMEGTVVSSPRWLPPPPDIPGRLLPPSDQTILTLRAMRLRNGTQWEPACGRVSVAVAGTLPDVRYGDSLRIIGKLSHPNRPQNPGDYDQATILRQQRILSVLRVNDVESVTKLNSGSWLIARWIERIRAGSRENISRYMEARHANLASAMILGMREEIDPELSQMMLESGAA